ncbi:Ni/Fe-hydrogenase, b-type cytochrome subunit [Pannonibacter phragmitetus]|uniref:Ni/Fe-hydrogenase, b-type cytochrome subunit n=1 Tax=Pannonibacter phragmitetus TaxID=121719 RepID=UPI000F44B4CD|nr:Ni/Fe-hydrogenase, b-type cytochrome subunit [Pannonibacter phragmitetus]MBA4203698.1 Ni/Fe-hydrogenase, b-type cytochrome subunit [Polymorphum sp.]
MNKDSHALELEAELATAQRQSSVYVYEAPVRIWHWVNASAILVLCVTGYFIGSPPPSVGQHEAYDQFLFGYIRFAHFAAGMILTVGFLGRIYWAIFGNHHARQLFYLPVLNGHWWREIWFEIRWYLFLESEPKKYVGHNPLAQLAMFFFITLGTSFMIVTGMALYAEGAGQGSLYDDLFGWVIGLAGNTQRLHTLHHLGMWWIVIFMIVHIYVAIREDIMSRQSIVSTMISGHRTFKDDRTD